MENDFNISREELEKMVEKAQKDLEEALQKMTPEERRQAQIKAHKLIEEDSAARQKKIDEAAKIAAQSVDEKKDKPNFCTNCGAPASEGKYCGYCGSLLTK